MAKTLVIDDDPETEAMFTACLATQGGTPGALGEFLFAGTDEEAMEILRQADDIDLAIVAVDSAVISGLGLFHKLEPKDARLPRIALASRSDFDQLRRALKEGASDFLIKPVDGGELKTTLSRVYVECERRRNTWKNESELSAIRREVEIAGDIQRRILPSRFPVRPGLEIFARTLPAKDIGGDFYDVFELPDKSLGLVVADVSGKGIPAAFYMAVARTLIRATAPHEMMPGKCLKQVNDLLCRHDVPGMFVSVFYGVLDPKNWTLTFANAGHPPPLLVSPVGNDGEGLVDSLEMAKGTLLGIDGTQEFGEGQMTLEKGEAVFFYTDGVTEAFDTENNAFGEESLWRCMAENANGSASDLAGAAATAITQFVGNAPQHDDLTSLVIKRS